MCRFFLSGLLIELVVDVDHNDTGVGGLLAGGYQRLRVRRRDDDRRNVLRDICSTKAIC